MEADRNSKADQQKFIGKIPEKALRSTFMIKDDEVRIGTVSSAYNNTATASQKMMSQTATQAWQEGNDDFE